MTSRHRIVGALLSVYPPGWRGEYGAELEDVLLNGSSRLGPQVIVNVLWHGLRQRAREFQTGRLWRRALVASVVMEIIAAVGAALRHIYGPGRGMANREFETPEYIVFVSIVAAPYCLGALLGMILPVASLLRTVGWFFRPSAAILLGIVFSVPAFAVVVFGGWMIDGWGSLADFVANVLRFPRANVSLLVMYAVGGAIVLSGQRAHQATQHPSQARSA